MEAAMIKKRILRSDRVRHPGGRFSFIPHRFLLGGFLKSLTSQEVLLYFFLTLASDNNGISYYGQKSICDQLYLDQNEYLQTLETLIKKDLIAYDGKFFQVLELPEKPVVLHRINHPTLQNLCRDIGKGDVR